MTAIILTCIILAALLVGSILIPLAAVKSRDRAAAKKAEAAAKEKRLNLNQFQRRLSELYKEEFALADGNSYFVDPKTMDRVKEIAENRKKINDLKTLYPEYEKEFNDGKLYENARYAYGNDLLYLQN